MIQWGEEPRGPSGLAVHPLGGVHRLRRTCRVYFHLAEKKRGVSSLWGVKSSSELKQ
jgi:hypothetical protein